MYIVMITVVNIVMKIMTMIIVVDVTYENVDAILVINIVNLYIKKHVVITQECFRYIKFIKLYFLLISYYIFNNFIKNESYL
jgi:hypothetical protein